MNFIPYRVFSFSNNLKAKCRKRQSIQLYQATRGGRSNLTANLSSQISLLASSRYLDKRIKPVCISKLKYTKKMSHLNVQCKYFNRLLVFNPHLRKDLFCYILLYFIHISFNYALFSHKQPE